MALDAGTRLGLYEILAPLGAGGMGEVSRFLIATVAAPPEVRSLNVIVNWQPTKK